jgi:hypothetical protein
MKCQICRKRIYFFQFKHRNFQVHNKCIENPHKHVIKNWRLKHEN